MLTNPTGQKQVQVYIIPISKVTLLVPRDVENMWTRKNSVVSLWCETKASHRWVLGHQ